MPAQTSIVAVIGMGYVGAVTAAGLCGKGLRVVGVEANPVKLAMLRRGESPVLEPGLGDALAAARRAGLLQTTDCVADAVEDADVIMIAVGTPAQRGGGVDLSAIDRVTAELAGAIADGKPRVLMIRSTVPPGVTQQRVAPVLRGASRQVIVCHHPEFLREGSALKDWAQPSMIVAGCDPADAAEVEATLATLYAGIDPPQTPRLILNTPDSELLKYACNAFHALKIDFANEVGTLAQSCGADPQNVLAALCTDRRLNIAPAYLKPGFAFGGSCLPKDTRALQHLATQHHLELPLLDSLLRSNSAHLRRQLERILQLGRRRTLLVGLSFKAGSDDLRESPLVELAEQLLGRGVPLTIHDPDLTPEKLVGANAAWVREHLPHLKLLLRTDLASCVNDAEVIVVGKPVAGLEAAASGRVVIDLTRLTAGDESAASDQPKKAREAFTSRMAA